MTVYEIILLSLCGLNACVSLVVGISKAVVYLKKKTLINETIKEQKEFKNYERLKKKYEK